MKIRVQIIAFIRFGFDPRLGVGSGEERHHLRL